MCAKVSYGIANMFSFTSRDRCMTKLKSLTIPKFGKTKKVSEKSAAVLVPLCQIEGVPSMLYTIRSTKLRTNSGQISFPGGKTDENENPVQTALRETMEEIGLCRDKIDVWGQGPTLPGRNYEMLITPVIGSVLDIKEEDLKINPAEVSEVFAVSVETLCDPKNHYHTQFRNGYILPVFVVERYKIWGITAYITHIFLSSILSRDVYSNEWLKKKVVIDNKNSL